MEKKYYSEEKGVRIPDKSDLRLFSYFDVCVLLSKNKETGTYKGLSVLTHIIYDNIIPISHFYNLKNEVSFNYDVLFENEDEIYLDIVFPKIPILTKYLVTVLNFPVQSVFLLGAINISIPDNKFQFYLNNNFIDIKDDGNIEILSSNQINLSFDLKNNLIDLFLNKDKDGKTIYLFIKNKKDDKILCELSINEKLNLKVNADINIENEEGTNLIIKSINGNITIQGKEKISIISDNNQIEIQGKEIKIESSNSNIIINSASDVQIQANGNCKVQATGNVEIDGSQILLGGSSAQMLVDNLPACLFTGASHTTTNTKVKVP